MRPIGYFVHHQGRGHAERAAAIINAIPQQRPVTIFCARDDIFPALRPGVSIIRIASLFEARGDEAGRFDGVVTPDTLHCAPLGWPGIRAAMARIANWFDEADPVLMIADVSAEIAQLARLCSVPCVVVVQHGARGDAGHVAAYQGAVGLLAPCAPELAQPDWPGWMRAKMHFAPGVGIAADLPSRAGARATLGWPADRQVTLVVSGQGGTGFAQAPLAVGARSFPDQQWITIGHVQRDWHATEPGNLIHLGWVEKPEILIAAADRVISSAGNTTCQHVLAAGKPWLVVPEWRYFDEQVAKALALARAGVAAHRPHLPSSAQDWHAALAEAQSGHDPARQAALIAPNAAAGAAAWLQALVARLWPNDAALRTVRPGKAPPATTATAAHRASSPLSAPSPAPSPAAPAAAPLPVSTPVTPELVMPHTPPFRTVSALTIARGRAGHLANVIRGLANQTQLPVELLIGVMQPQPYVDLPEAPFPVRQIHIPGDELPLALARNTVAREALSEVLAFVDVDCIPAPTLVADYASACAPGAGLMMGEVLYLPGGATEAGLDFDHFDAVGVKHSDRQGPPARPIERCGDYRCFWSLNFAMHSEDFAASGGFDERFRGYGGEDTDFGRTLQSAGIAINWIRGARVYHQYHPHHMPPVHHIDSVIRNADLFASKWGHRTMEHWLYAFGLMGLIRNTPAGLQVLRAPNDADFALCSQQSNMPYAATRRIIDLLHARQPAAPGKDIPRTGTGAEGGRTAEVEAAQKSMLLPAAE